MKLSQIKADIKEVALANGITTFALDWVNAINENNNNQYDIFMLMPPKSTRKVSPDNPDKVWDISFYIFRKNATALGEMNSSDERDIAWDELEIKAYAIMNAFFNRARLITKFGSIRLFPISDLEITFDEGLSNDGDVCVKGIIRIQSNNDC